MMSSDDCIEVASPSDATELNDLYFSVYGSGYPLKKGIEYHATREALEDRDHHLWLLAREPEGGRIIGSCIFELEPELKIGKVSGVVVHRNHRGRGISRALIGRGTNDLLNEKGLNSLYTTTRTVSVAPQMMFLKNGYIPLGLFPNAHKLHQFETVTLMGTFSKEALSQRVRVQKMPLEISKLAELVNETLDMRAYNPKTITLGKAQDFEDDEVHVRQEFEFIFAPEFVRKCYRRRFRKYSESGFYPFHEPNLLINFDRGDLEIYAYYNKKDRYCAIISGSKILRKTGLKFTDLLNAMKDYGISYVELLLRLDHCKSARYFLDAGFIPSALYPSMKEESAGMYDFVLLTQTMEPLNFQGMRLHESFNPYVKLYTSHWIHQHLDALEVYHDIRS